MLVAGPLLRSVSQSHRHPELGPFRHTTCISYLRGKIVPTITTSGISHIYLPSKDIDASIAFYTEHFGFKLLRKYRMGDRESAYVELGGILIELTVSDTTPAEDGRTELRLGLAVPDIAAALAELKRKGVTVAREPWDARTFWGRQAQIKDPSGYIISLREWREPDGPYYPDWKPSHDDVERLA
jgi:predicted enzyme related to lactoylglutathione lyase